MDLEQLMLKVSGIHDEVVTLKGNSEIKGDTGADWKSDVPRVSIKNQYLYCALPLAKGEQGCKRASWPKELHNDRLVVRAFSDYLGEDKNNQKDQKHDHLRASRLFDMVELSSGGVVHPVATEERASDPRLMSAIYTSNTYRDILNLPILDLKHGWAGKLLLAFIAFAR